MSSLLAEICEKKREHVVKCKAETPLSELESACKKASEPRDFRDALFKKATKGEIGLIGEIKKASPSKGLIREDFDPVVLAQEYQTGGATCLSILTDEPYFQGSIHDLHQAKAGCSLPVLRKDFILDSYQVAEARAYGADCILLIMAMLDDYQVSELEHAARQLYMDVLVEVHTVQELERALKCTSSKLIGINNRNLDTLEVDLATSETLVYGVPKGAVTVCESGIKTHADIKRMQQSNIHCFLVGESLMLQRNISRATKELLGK